MSKSQQGGPGCRREGGSGDSIVRLGTVKLTGDNHAYGLDHQKDLAAVDYYSSKRKKDAR